MVKPLDFGMGILTRMEMVSLSSNSPVCEGETIRINTMGGNTHIWNGPSNFTSNVVSPIINNAKLEMAGNYILTVTDQSGCSASQSINIQINPKPMASIVGDTLVCEGEEAVLTTINQGLINWFNGSNAQSVTFVPTNTQSYTMIFTEGGCSDTAQHVIRVVPLPTLNIAATRQQIYTDQDVRLKVTGAQSYIWDQDLSLSCLNCADPIATPQSTTQYCVQGDTLGCINKSCITITVVERCNVVLPNIFSPNGDGINDSWCSIKRECIKEQLLTVYDRWGNLIFTTSGEEVCWSPKDSQKALQTQVVTFILKTISHDDKQNVQSGSITLVE